MQVFPEDESIEELHLNAANLDMTQLSRYSKLKDLTLTDLKQFPKELCSLPLEDLLIFGDNDYQGLQEFPAEVCGLQLKTFCLYGHQISIVPKEIGTMNRLVDLSLSCMELDSLPKEVGLLVHLQILDLAINRLRRLPEELGNLINLKDLNVSDNYLTRLPESLAHIDFDNVDIASNSFYKLPRLNSKKWTTFENPIPSLGPIKTEFVSADDRLAASFFSIDRTNLIFFLQEDRLPIELIYSYPIFKSWTIKQSRFASLK